MRKALATLLTLTMLMGSLATTALAYELEVVEENVFTITDVYGINYFDSGTPIYICEDTATITVNSEMETFHVYVYNFSTYSWTEIGLAETYAGEPIFDSSDFMVTLIESGMSYTVLDYFDGVADGSIDGDADIDLMRGSSVTALAPLDYHIYISYEDGTTDGCYFSIYDSDLLTEIDIEEVLVMETSDDDAETTETEEVEAEEVEAEILTGTAAPTAAPTASTVLVDGEEVAFDAYNIDDNNYFKLRDIAYVLDGTEATFEVTWNQDTQAIEMTSGESYTATEGDMTLGDGSASAYTTSTAVIYLDGEEIELTAYTIADNNYFKLRDLGEALGFNVSWDQDAQTIVIASDEEYTAD